MFDGAIHLFKKRACLDGLTLVPIFSVKMDDHEEVDEILHLIEDYERNENVNLDETPQEDMGDIIRLIEAYEQEQIVGDPQPNTSGANFNADEPQPSTSGTNIDAADVQQGTSRQGQRKRLLSSSEEETSTMKKRKSGAQKRKDKKAKDVNKITLENDDKDEELNLVSVFSLF